MCVDVYFVGKNIVFANSIIHDRDLYESLFENKNLNTNDWCELIIPHTEISLKIQGFLQNFLDELIIR